MELSDEDRPAEEIWLNTEKLNMHFESVRERYASQSGGEPVDEPEGGMMENELLKGLRR